jgi:NTP pyrophosphatase (non-canonical NTP hydrolase)
VNLNDYQQLASRTLPPPGVNHWFQGIIFDADELSYEQTRAKLNEHAQRIDLVHAIDGICGEAGELINPKKRAMFYGKPLGEKEIANLKEEAGDLMWYIAGPLCRALGCTLEEICAANVAKLQLRYPDKYSDEAAIARNDKASDEE